MNDKADLDKQRNEKERKEAVLKKYQIVKASENLIDTLYYYEMFQSPACWKSAAIINREIKKLGIKSTKIRGLKENIRIRAIGLGWTNLATPWSRNGKDLAVEELTAHLISIIKIERKREIPDKAPVIIPVRKQLPILGNQAKEVIVIEENNNSKLEEFEKNTRDLKFERES